MVENCINLSSKFSPYFEHPYTQEQRKEIVAKQLIDLRKKYRLTQKEVSELIGVSPQAYSGYETAKYEPSMETLVRIALLYNTTTDYLLYKDIDPETGEQDLETVANENEKEKIDALMEEFNLMRAEIEELKNRLK